MGGEKRGDMSADEQALLAGIAGGDDEALGRLYASYRPRLRRYLWQQLAGDATAVVDVRTGRGYALGILSSRHLAITTIVVGSFTILAQVQPKQKLGITLLLMLYFALSVYVIATAPDRRGDRGR